MELSAKIKQAHLYKPPLKEQLICDDQGKVQHRYIFDLGTTFTPWEQRKL